MLWNTQKACCLAATAYTAVCFSVVRPCNAYSGLRRLCTLSVWSAQLHLVGSLLLSPHEDDVTCGVLLHSWGLYSGRVDSQEQHKACLTNACSADAALCCGPGSPAAQQRVLVGVCQLSVDGGEGWKLS